MYNKNITDLGCRPLDQCNTGSIITRPPKTGTHTETDLLATFCCYVDVLAPTATPSTWNSPISERDRFGTLHCTSVVTQWVILLTKWFIGTAIWLLPNPRDTAANSWYCELVMQWVFSHKEFCQPLVCGMSDCCVVCSKVQATEVK